MADMKHLSIVDGAFLHLETPEMPMHVGSLSLFEAPPQGAAAWLETVKAHIGSRMHLAPAFTRKLALMPFDLANPVWITDDDIDLDYHIRLAVLPKPGTLEQMHTLAARLHSSLLDRSRPLWEFVVIEGLADGRVGFYAKVHHAAVDGQAAVALANTIYDLTPEPRRVRPPRAARGQRYQLGIAELLSAAARNQLEQVVEFAKLLPPLARAALKSARAALAERRSASTALAQAKADTDAPSRWKLAPPSPFNTGITNQRAFASIALPLGELKAIGKAHEASVNDMVLWLCSTALREYLADARELPEKSLVAGVPISLRGEGDATSNNQVSGTTIDLATEVADPVQRLAVIRAGTQAMKRQMGLFADVLPKDFPSLGSPWLLSGLSSLYGRSGLASSLRAINVTISNVPGPQVPLYLAGLRLQGIFPLSIVVHGVALNITVQSYQGQLCFGLIACRRAVPDVAELAAALGRAMERARKLAPPAEAAGAAEAAAPQAPQAVPSVPLAAKAKERAKSPKPRATKTVAAAARAKPPARAKARGKPRLQVVAGAAAPAAVAAPTAAGGRGPRKARVPA